VSGSGGTPLPGGADRLSLLGPAAGWDRTHLDPGDTHDGPMQDGVEPLVSTLDGWCWRVAVGRSLGRPVRHARLLLRFLSVHHDWTVKQYWADDYAADLHALWVRCKALTGTFDGRPEPMRGVPCNRCDRMALVRVPGEDGRTCDRADGGCGWWLSEEQYQTWLGILGHYAKEAG
jgi:hypothetical protein